jgi:hypothetical protein
VLVRGLKVVKSVNMSSTEYRKRVMPIGALYAASLWLSNSAYLHLSVSFIQMTKALMPGLVYCIGCFMRTEPYSFKVLTLHSISTASQSCEISASAAQHLTAAGQHPHRLHLRVLRTASDAPAPAPAQNALGGVLL